jgi:hypothetical protein
MGGTVIKTAIHVVSSSPQSLVIRYPADASTGIAVLLIGLFVAVCGYFSLHKHQAEATQGLRWLLWFLPLLFALLSGAFGIFKAFTVITVEASAETGMLTVRHAVAGTEADRATYPLSEIQTVQIGFGRGCKFLYAVLADGSDPKLLPCSPKSGYSEVGQALNSFVQTLRTTNSSGR